MNADSAAPSFHEAMRFWLKLGFISFGGPAGQIAIMHDELVERRRWLSESHFLHALNYCMLLPGPEAQQLATYIGWRLHGTRGGIVAGTLFVLPSLLILVALSWAYMRFGNVAWVAGVFAGVKPAVTAIVLHAMVRIGSRTVNHWILAAIALAAFAAITVFKTPFPWIILTAALLGLLCSAFGVRPFNAAMPADGHMAGKAAPASPWHVLRVGLVCAALWFLPFVLLLRLSGWEGEFTQLALFFGKAAFVTFGGAYSVLPYIVQGAVEQHGWLSAAQMLDGLALGETTPGPLIMVVAFVGFVTGYGHQSLGADALFAAGALGALVVTWFTFLPSFFFILAGGPLVERSQGSVRLRAALTAVTAAVVGAILNLALYFALHVWWPQGRFDLLSFILSLASFFILLRFPRSLMAVLAGSAVIGALSALL